MQLQEEEEEDDLKSDLRVAYPRSNGKTSDVSVHFGGNQWLGARNVVEAWETLLASKRSILIFLIFMSGCIWAERGFFAASLPNILAQLNTDDNHAMFLDSIYIAGFVASSPVWMLLSQRLPPFKEIGLGLVLWSFGSIITGSGRTVWVLYFGRVLTGIGEAGLFCLAEPVIDKISSLPWRVAWNGWFLCSIPAFYCSFHAISINYNWTYWNDIYKGLKGWRIDCYILGGLMLLVGFVFLLGRGPQPLGKKSRDNLTDARFRISCILMLAGIALQSCMVGGFIFYLLSEFRVGEAKISNDPDDGAIVVDILAAVGGILGLLLGAYISDFIRTATHPNAHMVASNLNCVLILNGLTGIFVGISLLIRHRVVLICLAFFVFLFASAQTAPTHTSLLWSMPLDLQPLGILAASCILRLGGAMVRVISFTEDLHINRGAQATLVLVLWLASILALGINAWSMHRFITTMKSVNLGGVSVVDMFLRQQDVNPWNPIEEIEDFSFQILTSGDGSPAEDDKDDNVPN